MAEFKESEHPRDKDGKFTDKNSTSKSQQLKTALQVFAKKKNINQITEEMNIGIYVNKQKSSRYNTQHGRIHYSNKGTHIVPDGKDRK